MPAYVTESGGELAIERSAERRPSEEELREARTKRFMALLDETKALQVGDGAVDSAEVRRAHSMPEDALDREVVGKLGERLRAAMLRAAADS